MARVAGLFRDTALKFECTETIEYRARYAWVSDCKEQKLLDVRQTYEKYRFFQVASREKIKGIVEGKTPAAPAP